MTMRIIPANWFDEAADLAVSPAAVSAYPITALQSSDRDDLWQSPNLDPQTITFTWGGNVRPVNSWAIFPGGGNLVGATARLVLRCAGATVYDSGALDVYTFTGATWGDFDWGSAPWGVAVEDRDFRRAPLVKFITEVAADAGTLTIANAGAMDTPAFSADRFWLGQSVLAPYTANHGLAPQWVDLSEHQRSPSAVLRVQANETHRRMQFDTVFESEADRFAWSQILGFCGKKREIVLALLPDDATTLGRELTIRGYLETLNPLALTNPNFNTLQLAITES